MRGPPHLIVSAFRYARGRHGPPPLRAANFHFGIPYYGGAYLSTLRPTRPARLRSAETNFPIKSYPGPAADTNRATF
ncbi:hypothetical protein EVAR_42660_1 [Eumeta japonica]|uniref:Uncharacterized protein n=1 Tax=Eumeta variegata TaxID=151549 RepID=A0A4C1YQB3_EUMVA|nr:hypothetical protein EVAR_42660_1 [Eumeta japonica]